MAVGRVGDDPRRCGIQPAPLKTTTVPKVLRGWPQGRERGSGRRSKPRNATWRNGKAAA